MKNRGVIIISSLVVIGGGIAFLLWKLSKNKEEQRLKDEEAAKAALANQNTGGGTPGGSTPPVATTTGFTFPFKTTAEGNAFRAFVIKTDPTFATSINLSKTGPLNAFLQKAWDKYGADYLKQPIAFTSGIPTGSIIRAKFPYDGISVLGEDLKEMGNVRQATVISQVSGGQYVYVKAMLMGQGPYPVLLPKEGYVDVKKVQQTFTK